MALILTIGGVDHTSYLCHETLSVNQTADGLNSTCTFDLMGHVLNLKDIWIVETTRVVDGDVIIDRLDPKAKAEVSIADGATVYFAGILSRINALPLGEKTRVLSCSCHDFNQMLEEDVVDTLEEFAAKTDEQIIDTIFAGYVTDIDYATHVDGGAYTFDKIAFENVTVRQVMDTICAQSGCVWYIDYSKKLHYSAAEANTPGWHLSDDPDQATSFSYFENIQRDEDATNLVNKALVVGSASQSWFQDSDSIDLYGTHSAIIRGTTIISDDDLQARGESILAKYKDPVVTYTLGTYQDGLRAGMHIRVVSDLYALDETLLINQLTITFPVDGAPEYHLTCGGLVSSGATASRRLELDQLHNYKGTIGGGQLPLASRGWGHDLEFSSTDDDTVAWTAGTITTVDGAAISIDAGNTDDPGAMAAVTFVYFDANISLTELQMTTSSAAAVGANRILVAVCAPNADPTKDAEYSVFGGGDGSAGVLISQGNIAANSITGNEIQANSIAASEIMANTITAAEVAAGAITATEMTVAQLSAITASMGTLTAGTIQTDGPGNNRVVLDMVNGLRGISAANVVQFHLNPTTGKAYFGVNAVVLDVDGITIDMGGDLRNRISFNHLGTERGYIWPKAYSAGPHLAINCGPPTISTHGSDIILNAVPHGGSGFQTGIDIISKYAAVHGYIGFHTEDGNELIVKGGRIEVYNDLRVGKGLYVGSLFTDPDDDDIWCDGEISTNGGTDKFDLGAWVGSGDITSDGYIRAKINGVNFRFLCRSGW